jgi:hypothetical protein
MGQSHEPLDVPLALCLAKKQPEIEYETIMQTQTFGVAMHRSSLVDELYCGDAYRRLRDK